MEMQHTERTARSTAAKRRRPAASLSVDIAQQSGFSSACHTLALLLYAKLLRPLLLVNLTAVLLSDTFLELRVGVVEDEGVKFVLLLAYLYRTLRAVLPPKRPFENYNTCTSH